MNLYADEKKPKRPVSSSAIVRIVIWTIVLIILCSIFFLGMIGASFRGILTSFGSFSIGGFAYSDEDSYAVGGGAVSDAATVTDMDIDWLNGDIEILPAEAGVTEITITESYDGEEENRLRWRVRDGELQIKFKKSSWWAGNHNLPSKKLTIRLPEGHPLNEVDVNTTKSDITFEGYAKEFNLESVNGKLIASGHIGELDIDSVDADVNFNGSLGTCDFDGVNVHAVLRLTEARELDIDGVDYDVTLYLADTITGFRIDHDSVGGNMKIEGFEGVGARGDYDEYWGDGSLTILSDGVDAKLTVKKSTEN